MFFQNLFLHSRMFLCSFKTFFYSSFYFSQQWRLSTSSRILFLYIFVVSVFFKALFVLEYKISSILEFYSVLPKYFLLFLTLFLKLSLSLIKILPESLFTLQNVSLHCKNLALFFFVFSANGDVFLLLPDFCFSVLFY